MKSKDYIINELEHFIKKFSKVRVRYEYDENALVHTIEVLPNEIYHLDEEYILWERQMFEKFISSYSTENICFISDDALVGIENPIFKKEGLEYDAIFSMNEVIVTFDQNVILIEQTTSEAILDITIADIETCRPFEEIRVTEEYNNYSPKFFFAA